MPRIIAANPPKNSGEIRLRPVPPDDDSEGVAVTVKALGCDEVTTGEDVKVSVTPNSVAVIVSVVSDNTPVASASKSVAGCISPDSAVDVDVKVTVGSPGVGDTVEVGVPSSGVGEAVRVDTTVGSGVPVGVVGSVRVCVPVEDRGVGVAVASEGVGSAVGSSVGGGSSGGSSVGS
jgi:hypothetical protein